jgi:hypothetical protein
MDCAFRHRCQRGDVDALETNTGVNAPEINALESDTLTDGIVCHNEGGPRRPRLRRLRVCRVCRVGLVLPRPACLRRRPASDGTR